MLHSALLFTVSDRSTDLALPDAERTCRSVISSSSNDDASLRRVFSSHQPTSPGYLKAIKVGQISKRCVVFVCLGSFNNVSKIHMVKMTI